MSVVHWCLGGGGGTAGSLPKICRPCSGVAPHSGRSAAALPSHLAGLEKRSAPTSAAQPRSHQPWVVWVTSGGVKMEQRCIKPSPGAPASCRRWLGGGVLGLSSSSSLCPRPACLNIPTPGAGCPPSPSCGGNGRSLPFPTGCSRALRVARSGSALGLCSCCLFSFSGLIPRLLGDILSLWLCNMLAYLINTYALENGVRALCPARGAWGGLGMAQWRR